MPPWTNCVTVAHSVPWDHPSRSHLASRHPAAAARESPGPRHTMYLPCEEQRHMANSPLDTVCLASCWLYAVQA